MSVISGVGFHLSLGSGMLEDSSHLSRSGDHLFSFLSVPFVAYILQSDGEGNREQQSFRSKGTFGDYCLYLKLPAGL